MRTARPKKLYSGRWGAWVTGGNVAPDMLTRVRARNGKSWYSRVGRVLWQGTWGAICERIDIAEEDELDLEIPFLDNFRPDNEAASLLLGQIRKLVYDWVEDANGPAPFIEHYEYYNDLKSDRDFYHEFLAKHTIGELDREVETWLRANTNQWAEVTLNSQQECVSDEDIRTDFWEEYVRRQRERIPRQIAGLSDYNRLYGRDSAH